MKKILISLFIIILAIGTHKLTSAAEKKAETLYKKGEMAYNSRKYTSALHYYRKALKINPYYKEARIGKGKTFFQLKSYKESHQEFKIAESQFKNDHKIKIWLARIQLMRMNPDSAESYLLKAIQLKPKDYDIYILYGDIYFQKKSFSNAIQHYEEARQINGNNELAYLKLGKSYLMLNKPAKAFTYLEKAEMINNRNPLTQYYLGDFYYQQKDYIASERHLNTALLISPTHVPSMNIMFQVLFELEKWQVAKDILNKLLAMHPKNKKYYYLLGIALEKTGDPERSLAVLMNGMNIDIADEALRFMAEKIYYKYFWTNAAIRKRGKNLAVYWYKKGKDYLRQNLSDYAVFSFRRGIRLNPNHWRMRWALAKIYKRRGLTNVYYNELMIIRGLAPNNRNIDDEIRFTERLMKRLLSNKKGIDQYSLPKTKPKIALVFFKKNRDFKNHYGVEKLYREILYTTLKMEHKINVTLITETQNFKNEEEIARDQNADFILTGEVNETEKDVTVKLRISNLSDGETYKMPKITQRGNDRFITSALLFAYRIKNYFPVVGKIIRKNYKEVYLNIGKRHGFKIKDRFYIIKSKETLNKLINHRKLFKIVSREKLLTQILLSYKKDRRMGLEEIEITQIDENISKGRIITSDFYDEVNINNYVIHKP